VKFSLFKNWIFFYSWFLLSITSAEISGELRICALMVSFQEDDKESTTGNGKFLSAIEGIDCGTYHIDSPPHDGMYFHSQLKAANNYFQSVSYGKFGINLTDSDIYPGASASYELSQSMSYYYPYNEENISEDRLVELFKESIETAFIADAIDYSIYDLVIVFHAGIGQDFSLPFLDPTPEDIPSTYVDPNMIKNSTGENGITIGSSTIEKGIILPETQNHLNYAISNSMFASESDPCDYQYGLTGTLSLMIGFAVGLPPLWDIESGKSRIGVFGLMDQGSNNGRGIVPSPPDPWSRIHAGWELPTIVTDNSQVNLPKISQNKIIRVDINETEYFLIENRINHYRKGVSLDSIRFKTWQDTDNYPSFIKSLKDSVSIESDNNGVITRIPDYDIGLPGSGLLIWHIDENRIQHGIDDYSINKDINLPGIDIEEADGAQDIGQQSFFMFNDPSSGYFGDMWFAENEEYYRANPQSKGSLPSFYDNSYPNTSSNNGSKSHISIENIGSAHDTATFNIINTLKPYGYSDSSAYYRAFFTLDNAGSTILLIGGLDSLWFIKNINDSSRTYFHSLISNEVLIGMNNSGEVPLVEVFEYFHNSMIHSVYEYDNDYENLSFRGSVTIDSLVYPVYRNNFQEKSLLNQQQWDEHNSSVFGHQIVYRINEQNGISITSTSGEEDVLNELSPSSISGIDLNLDAIPDLLVRDSSNMLSAYNYQLIKLPNFPIDYRITGTILAKNIFGDNHPEIIAKSMDSSSIYIFDHQGSLFSTIATEKNDELVLIATINQNNCIITRFNIFQFNDYVDSQGNQWVSEHGDQGNSRMLDILYTTPNTSEKIVSNAYCYPNPIKTKGGTIRIETNNPTYIEINVYDAAGYFIKKYSNDVISNGISITEWKFDTSKLESGIYFAYLEAKANSSSKISDYSQIIKIAVIK